MMTINKISIIGGTGKEGKGLAYRWAKAGFDVIIGSRQMSILGYCLKTSFLRG